MFIIGGDESYGNWTPCTLVSTIQEAELVMFTGGTDINPSIYGKKAHWKTQTPDLGRDAREMSAFDFCIQNSIPMVGICRGAQLLCALNGGILVQHQVHPNYHWITTYDGLKFFVTSDHHQRAHPYVPDCTHKLIAWAFGNHDGGLSYFNDGESTIEKMVGQEAEIVYYPKTKCLGIQSHPEWQFPAKGQDEEKTLSYFRSLIHMLVKGTL